MSGKQGLHDAFKAARYVVCTEPAVEFKIGIASDGLDCLMSDHGAQQAVFVTAHNPAGECLTEQENSDRTAKLEKTLKQADYEYLEGFSTSEDDQWPREASFLVFGIDCDAASKILRPYHQSALVWLESGCAPTLYWLD